MGIIYHVLVLLAYVDHCHDPWDFLILCGLCCEQGLTVKEMEELREDIKVYAELDRSTDLRIQFWEVLL